VSLPAPDDFGAILRRAQAERRLPSLSAAVAHGGEVVWAEAVGLADVEQGREATADDQYMVGSITKTFTAAAVLQLVEAGEVDLDDPLERHVPGAAHGSTRIGRMLSHLSGLQREPGEVWESLDFPDREGLVARLGEAEQLLGPGERWHYSNLAFALLGEVVARRSGLEYGRYVEERLLGPLGLARTSWTASAPAARGYFVDPHDDSVRPEPTVDKRAFAAAGALWSTPSDLCRWAAFLTDPDETVLSRAGAESMRDLQVMAEPARWTLGYGRGLQLVREGDRVFAGHGGATIGFRAGLLFAPEEGIAAAALANSGTSMELEVALELLRTALDRFPASPEAWRPGESAPPDVAGLLGPWWSEGEELVLRYVGGRLEVRSARADATLPPTVLAPDGTDRYRVVSGRERGERLRVVRDGSGTPVKLYLATYPLTREPRAFGDPG
jgi:CubicO group peptidase (beta-lactamase class C family)